MDPKKVNVFGIFQLQIWFITQHGKWAYSAALFYEERGVEVDVLYNVLVIYFHFIDGALRGRLHSFPGKLENNET